MKSYTSLILSIVFFLCCGSFIQAQPTNYSNTANYNVGDLVVSGSATYIAIVGNSGQTPPNTTYWTDLSVAATALNIPVELVPSIDITTILASLPNAAPDSDSSIGDSGTQNAKLTSVNVRGTIGSGGDKRIMGFITSSTSEILMRGIGPQLVDFNLAPSTLLPDPIMTLFKYKDPQNTLLGSDPIAAGNNDNYTSNSNVSAIDAIRSTLLPVLSFNPKQAVSMPSLTPGFYTCQIEDKNGAAGIGVAAVDLANDSGSGFTHLSSRGLVKTSEYMFGGFQIVGTGTRNIFIRGRGPSLAQYNVPNVMTNPNLNLSTYDVGPGSPSTEIDMNDKYGTESNHAEILSLSTTLYGWPAIMTNESALLLDLGPGYYTVQLISDSAASDGNGWLGIDDVTDN
jgi:hypothetical protein